MSTQKMEKPSPRDLLAMAMQEDEDMRAARPTGIQRLRRGLDLSPAEELPLLSPAEREALSGARRNSIRRT